MELSKRKFFIIVVGVVVFFFLFRWRKVFRHLLFSPKGQKVLPIKSENRYVEAGKTLVSIVHGEDEETMVRQAVKLIGGWEKIQVQGKKILVKPNVVTGDPPPTTTNPLVVKAVVKELYDNGASQVWVGDMSGLIRLPTSRNMEKTGIQKAAEEAGARVLYFEKYNWMEVPLPQGRYIDRAFVSEWVFRADRIINLPVIKTHRYAVYSISLKNFIGALHPRQRPYLIDSKHWEEVVAEFNLAYTPHLNILDGTTIMVRGGPQHGDAKNTNLILASGDRIAADLVGLALIKDFGQCQEIARRNIWEQRQIKRAVQLGLGVSAPGEIKLLHKNLSAKEAGFLDLVQRIESFLEI